MPFWKQSIPPALTRPHTPACLPIFAAQEFDGSDSGARPDEAVSWGKISAAARPVKVCADATLMLPLIIAQTFYKHWARTQA